MLSLLYCSALPNHLYFITNFCVVWPSIFEVQSLGVFDSINLPLSTLTSFKIQSLILNIRILMMRSRSMSIALFFKFLLMLLLEMSSLEKDPLLVLYSLIVVVLSFIDQRVRPLLLVVLQKQNSLLLSQLLSLPGTFVVSSNN